MNRAARRARRKDLKRYLGDAARAAAAGRHKEAEDLYRRILEIDPDHAEANFHLGALASRRGDYRVALDLLRRAVELKPDFAQAWHTLGLFYDALGRLPEAMAAYERALTLVPDAVPSLFNLANDHRAEGRFDEAKALLRRCIELAPDLAEAYYALTEIAHPDVHDPAIVEARRRLRTAQGLTPQQRALLHFSIAKAQENSGEFSRAFESFRRANALKAGMLKYDPSAMSRRFERIREVFTAGFIARHARPEAPARTGIVFIVGMPRSGTTLLEQRLAAHGRVCSLGESPLFPHLAENPPGVTGVVSEYPLPPASYTDEVLAGLGRAYRRRALQGVPAGRIAVDKLPGNFFYLGLIALALPEARIVHIQRDPLDTCLSNFQQLYDSGQDYSYDLDHLGRYYLDYHRLMRHWRECIPERIHEVRYEALVTTPEEVLPRVFAYCGLDWEERCLDAPADGTRIFTASVFQARQPIHSSSVGRWSRYREGLSPLIRMFERAGITGEPRGGPVPEGAVYTRRT